MDNNPAFILLMRANWIDENGINLGFIKQDHNNA